MNTVEIAVGQPEQVETGTSNWRDWLGVVASIGCAIHCAAMPFVIAYLPAMGLSFLADEGFHKWMALVCFLIAIVAFIPGLRKHRNWLPIAVGGFGLAFITFAAFGLAGKCCPSCEPEKANVAAAESDSKQTESGCEECEECSSCGESESSLVSSGANELSQQKDLLTKLAPWITPFGGVLLICAHLMNKRLGSLCSCC